MEHSLAVPTLRTHATTLHSALTAGLDRTLRVFPHAVTPYLLPQPSLLFLLALYTPSHLPPRHSASFPPTYATTAALPPTLPPAHGCLPLPTVPDHPLVPVPGTTTGGCWRFQDYYARTRACGVPPACRAATIQHLPQDHRWQHDVVLPRPSSDTFHPLQRFSPCVSATFLRVRGRTRRDILFAHAATCSMVGPLLPPPTARHRAPTLPRYHLIHGRRAAMPPRLPPMGALTMAGRRRSPSASVSWTTALTSPTPAILYAGRRFTALPAACHAPRFLRLPRVTRCLPAFSLLLHHGLTRDGRRQTPLDGVHLDSRAANSTYRYGALPPRAVGNARRRSPRLPTYTACLSTHAPAVPPHHAGTLTQWAPPRPAVCLAADSCRMHYLCASPALRPIHHATRWRDYLPTKGIRALPCGNAHLSVPLAPGIAIAAPAAFRAPPRHVFPRFLLPASLPGIPLTYTASRIFFLPSPRLLSNLSFHAHHFATGLRLRHTTCAAYNSACICILGQTEDMGFATVEPPFFILLPPSLPTFLPSILGLAAAHSCVPLLRRTERTVKNHYHFGALRRAAARHLRDPSTGLAAAKTSKHHPASRGSVPAASQPVAPHIPFRATYRSAVLPAACGFAVGLVVRGLTHCHTPPARAAAQDPSLLAWTTTASRALPRNGGTMVWDRRGR